MIVIGEKLNSSIPSAREAMERGDMAWVADLAKRQQAAGARYLDINASMLPDEAGALVRVAKAAREAAPGVGLMLDSPDPETLAFALGALGGENVILNSVTLEPGRLNRMLPLAAQAGTGLVALPVSEAGMPHSAAERVDVAARLIEKTREAGIPDARVYIDIVVEAASAAWEAPRQSLLAARELREKYPEIHLLAGLSNVSFGRPRRAAVNTAMMIACATMGVDAFIIDPLAKEMRMHIAAAGVVNAADEYCMSYIETWRELYDEE